MTTGDNDNDRTAGPVRVGSGVAAATRGRAGPRRDKALHAREDRDANDVMLRAMIGVSEPFMEALLDGYEDGFEGVGTLVDVGGSSGACPEKIMRPVPTIREGVNFDLPDVVAAAPPIIGETFNRQCPPIPSTFRDTDLIRTDCS
ncbi:hypothetical protein ZWY2020_040169 [Hordeum vulgare]|nr:hypothetical protein ZWY2020_040169 [Hordeum vulgare]